MKKARRIILGVRGILEVDEDGVWRRSLVRVFLAWDLADGIWLAFGILGSGVQQHGMYHHSSALGVMEHGRNGNLQTE